MNSSHLLRVVVTGIFSGLLANLETIVHFDSSNFACLRVIVEVGLGGMNFNTRGERTRAIRARPVAWKSTRDWLDGGSNGR